MDLGDRRFDGWDVMKNPHRDDALKHGVMKRKPLGVGLNKIPRQAREGKPFPAQLHRACVRSIPYVRAPWRAHRSSTYPLPQPTSRTRLPRKRSNA